MVSLYAVKLLVGSVAGQGEVGECATVMPLTLYHTYFMLFEQKIPPEGKHGQDVFSVKQIKKARLEK